MTCDWTYSEQSSSGQPYQPADRFRRRFSDGSASLQAFQAQLQAGRQLKLDTLQQVS